MSVEPIVGKPVRFPPGKVEVRLNDAQRMAYKRLYDRYRTNLDGLPVLRDRDLDGRPVKMTQAELDALNAALASLGAPPSNRTGSAFGAQEATKARLFKRIQYLS